MIDGVCCEYCRKHEQDECPIKNADPWSRWDYCCHFENNNGEKIEDILQEKK